MIVSGGTYQLRRPFLLIIFHFRDSIPPVWKLHKQNTTRIFQEKQVFVGFIMLSFFGIYIEQHFCSLPNDTYSFNKSEFSWRATFTAVDSSFNENKLKGSNLAFKHSKN